MLKQDLYDAINSGKCVAFVGAGASCALGYPSWHQLAVDTIAQFEKLGLMHDRSRIQPFLKEQKYPELFRVLEKIGGSRKKLIEVMSQLLHRSSKGNDFLYKTITRWPFAFYVTTNFDNEFSTFLNGSGHHFETLQNSHEDMRLIRADSRNIIVKAHGDFDHPEGAIITSVDYDTIETSSEKHYFRSKIESIFQMFSVCIIGYRAITKSR